MTLAPAGQGGGGGLAGQVVERAEAVDVALALDRAAGHRGGGADGPAGVGVEGAAALQGDRLALVVPGRGGRGRARGRAQGEHHRQHHEGGGQVGGQHPGRAGRGAGGTGPGRGTASADGHAHGSLLSRHGVVSQPGHGVVGGREWAVDNRTPSAPGSATLPSGGPTPGLGVSPGPGGQGPGQRAGSAGRSQRAGDQTVAGDEGRRSSCSGIEIGSPPRGLGTGPVTAGVAGRYEGRRGAAGAMVGRSGTEDKA